MWRINNFFKLYINIYWKKYWSLITLPYESNFIVHENQKILHLTPLDSYSTLNFVFKIIYHLFILIIKNIKISTFNLFENYRFGYFDEDAHILITF